MNIRSAGSSPIVVFVLFVLFTFVLTAVFGSPAPPTPGEAAIQELFDELVRQSNGDPWGLLQRQAPYHTVQAPSQFAGHSNRSPLPMANPHQTPNTFASQENWAPDSFSDHPFQAPVPFADRPYQAFQAFSDRRHQMPAAFSGYPRQADAQPLNQADARYRYRADTGQPHHAGGIHPYQTVQPFQAGAIHPYQAVMKNPFQPGEGHAGPAAVPLLWGAETPRFPVTPPTHATRRELARPFPRSAVWTDSISMSSVTQDSHLTQGTTPSPQGPILEGVPVGILPRRHDSFELPTGNHLLLHGGPLSTRHALTPEASHEVLLKEAPVTEREQGGPDVDDPEDLDNSEDPDDPEFLPGQDMEPAYSRGRAGVYGWERPLFRTVYDPDPAVDALVANLKSRIRHSGVDVGDDATSSGRVQMPAFLLDKLDHIAISTFWNRAAATELLMPSQPEPKRLFLIYNTKLRFLDHLHGSGFVGVWEINPQPQGSLSSLRLYGHYPMTHLEYIQLNQQPEAAGNFWIRARHGGHKLGSGLRLTITRMSDQQARLTAELLESGNPHITFSMMDGNRPKPMRVFRGTRFQNVYVYRESDEVSQLVHRWTVLANLPQSSFIPIRLDPEQQERFTERIPMAFRNARLVRMSKLDNGEPIMLCYHGLLDWLPRYRRSVVTVWMFGAPQYTGGDYLLRRMYAAGVFHLSKTTWDKLPQVIPGLRDTYFRYDKPIELDAEISQSGQSS